MCKDVRLLKQPPGHFTSQNNTHISHNLYFYQFAFYILLFSPLKMLLSTLSLHWVALFSKSLPVSKNMNQFFSDFPYKNLIKSADIIV